LLDSFAVEKLAGIIEKPAGKVEKLGEKFYS
jgi:hypothetical protein